MNEYSEDFGQREESPIVISDTDDENSTIHEDNDFSTKENGSAVNYKEKSNLVSNKTNPSNNLLPQIDATRIATLVAQAKADAKAEVTAEFEKREAILRRKLEAAKQQLESQSPKKKKRRKIPATSEHRHSDDEWSDSSCGNETECEADPQRKRDHHLQKAAHYNQMVSRDTREKNMKLLPDFVKEITRTIEEIGLAKKCNFGWKAYVKRVAEIALGNKDQSQQTTSRLYAGGHTQSGKSTFKAVLLIVGHHFKIPSIIITKGINESKDLAEKLRKLVGKHEVGKHICSLSGTKKKELPNYLENYGAIVSAHTGYQADKQRNEMEEFQKQEALEVEEEARKGEELENLMGRTIGTHKRQIFVVFDEADDFIRRPEGDPIQLEKAHQRILNLNPSCVLYISATLMPVFQRALDQNKEIKGQDIFLTNCKNPQYWGLQKAKPMMAKASHATQELEEEPVFLDHNSLKPKNLYTDDNVLELYKQANTYGDNALLLDVSDSRVHADGNIVEKGTDLRPKFPTMCFIAYAASYMQILFPGTNVWVEAKQKDGGKVPPISDLLLYLDSLNDQNIGDNNLTFENFKNNNAPVNLESHKKLFTPHKTPIAVIGYSKMERCISFRTEFRVPTHMLVALSNGLSFDRLVQVLGRGTFMNAPRGFESVVVLTQPSDWDAARCYLNFQEKTIELLQQSPTKSLQKILDEHIYTDDCNYEAFSSRTVGAKKTRLCINYITEGVKFYQGNVLGDHREGMRAVINNLAKDSITYVRQLMEMFFNTPGELKCEKIEAEVKKLLDEPDNRTEMNRAFLCDDLKKLTARKIIMLNKDNNTYKLNAFMDVTSDTQENADLTSISVEQDPPPKIKRKRRSSASRSQSPSLQRNFCKTSQIRPVDTQYISTASSSSGYASSSSDASETRDSQTRSNRDQKRRRIPSPSSPILSVGVNNTRAEHEDKSPHRWRRGYQLLTSFFTN